MFIPSIEFFISLSAFFNPLVHSSHALANATTKTVTPAINAPCIKKFFKNPVVLEIPPLNNESPLSVRLNSLLTPSNILAIELLPLNAENIPEKPPTKVGTNIPISSKSSTILAIASDIFINPSNNPLAELESNIVLNIPTHVSFSLFNFPLKESTY